MTEIQLDILRHVYGFVLPDGSGLDGHEMVLFTKRFIEAAIELEEMGLIKTVQNDPGLFIAKKHNRAD